MATNPPPRPDQGTPDFTALLGRYGFLPTGLSVNSLFTTWDGHMRLSRYVQPLKVDGGALWQLYQKGLLGEHQVVTHTFVKLRENLMNVTRSWLTPGALAMSAYLKEKSPSEGDLRLKYSRQLGLNPYSQQVSEMIMQKALDPSKTVTAAATNMRFFGITGFLLLMPGTVWYRIYKAPNEDRVYEMFRLGGEVMGGTLAAWKGLPAMWGACKYAMPKVPSAYALALHVVFGVAASTVGSYAGGKATDAVVGRKF
jgi:hypothetical protein